LIFLDDIRAAHADLEHNRTFGKHVVLTAPDTSLPTAPVTPRGLDDIANGVLIGGDEAGDRRY